MVNESPDSEIQLQTTMPQGLLKKSKMDRAYQEDLSVDTKTKKEAIQNQIRRHFIITRRSHSGH